LENYLRTHSQILTIPKILKFCSQISVALEHLFKNHVVHRDIKLNNILLSSNETPIICDFGEAILVDDNGTGQVDSPGGNQKHIAPEVLNQFSRTTKSHSYLVDYSKQPSWELGVICYEISVGDHPFGDYPIGHGDAPNLHVNNVDISPLETRRYPDLFISILKGLLEDNPKNRISITAAYEAFFNYNVNIV